MEKELLGSFAVAEKAAAAAAMAEGGSAEEDRCLDALKRMKRMPVTTKDLVATQVGKRIRGLTKHPNRRIQEVATDLFKFWKNVVIQETSKEVKESSSSDDRKPLKTKSNSERSDATKVDKTSNSDSSKSDMRLKSKSCEAEKSPSDKCLISEKFSRSETVKIETSETINGIETIKVERLSREQKHVSSATKHSIANGPPKLTSMIKCNDPLRDKLRELLAEAFSRVSLEASEDDREEVRNFVDEINACDPIRVAIIVESAMFEKLGKSNGTHKVKYRSIMFNLKDAKNTDLRRRVLLGHIVPEKLVGMTAEEMASDERKMANKQIQEKALFECERGAAPKATTDQFKCGRCGQRKCTYYQLQTRSADEPMTTFVTCVNCNNHWKFC